MSNLQALEQMTAAVDCLYLPDRPLKERVALAQSHLQKIDIAEDLPAPMRPRLERLMATFSAAALNSPDASTVFAKELMFLTEELRNQMRPS